MKQFRAYLDMKLLLKMNLLFNTMILIVLLARSFPVISTLNFFVSFVCVPAVFFWLYFLRGNTLFTEANRASAFNVSVNFLFSFWISSRFFNFDWSSYQLLSNDFVLVIILFQSTVTLLAQIVMEKNKNLFGSLMHHPPA